MQPPCPSAAGQLHPLLHLHASRDMAPIECPRYAVFMLYSTAWMGTAQPQSACLKAFAYRAACAKALKLSSRQNGLDGRGSHSELLALKDVIEACVFGADKPPPHTRAQREGAPWYERDPDAATYRLYQGRRVLLPGRTLRSNMALSCPPAEHCACQWSEGSMCVTCSMSVGPSDDYVIDQYAGCTQNCHGSPMNLVSVRHLMAVDLVCGCSNRLVHVYLQDTVRRLHFPSEASPGRVISTADAEAPGRKPADHLSVDLSSHAGRHFSLRMCTCTLNNSCMRSSA